MLYSGDVSQAASRSRTIVRMANFGADARQPSSGQRWRGLNRSNVGASEIGASYLMQARREADEHDGPRAELALSRRSMVCSQD